MNAEATPTFGDVRSVLHEAPSPAGWRALCDLLERVPHEVYSAQMSSYTRDRLRAWPDALRVCPRRWVDRAIDGAPPAPLELVRALDLNNRGMRDEDLAPIVSLAALAPVKHLDLGSNWLEERAAAALARAAHLTNARTLILNQNQLGDAGCAHLGRAAALRGLRALHLARNDLSADGLAPLLRSPTCAQLETLELSSNWLADLGEALSGADLPHLTGLLLDNVGLGDAGVRALTRVRSRVSALVVSRNRLTPLSAQLIGWSDAMSLTSLDLSENRVGDQGMRFLADSSMLSELRALDLTRNDVHGDGLAAFSDAPHLGALEHLSLAHNAITGRGLALGDDGGLPALRALDLSRNPLGDEGAAALARALTARTAPPLHTLKLDACGLTGEGIRRLLSHPWAAHLEHLSLSHNGLGDEGALALARTPGLTRLRTLELVDSTVSSDGLRELARSPHLPSTLRAQWQNTASKDER